MYTTSVVALSAMDAQAFRSEEPYVVIQLTDSAEIHPEIREDAPLRAKMGCYFDDVVPGAIPDLEFVDYVVMDEAHARAIAEFVRRWYGEVATIVVHCKMGLSRSTGVAVAIREYYGKDYGDLYSEGRNPNPHCRSLVAEALRAG